MADDDEEQSALPLDIDPNLLERLRKANASVQGVVAGDTMMGMSVTLDGDPPVNTIYVRADLPPTMKSIVITKELAHLENDFDEPWSELQFRELLGNLKYDLPAHRPEISLSSVIIPEKKVQSGKLIVAHTAAFAAVCRRLRTNWNLAYELDPEKWEEIIAASFSTMGFDEVVLTPRWGALGET